MIADSEDPHYMRKSMQAGARDYLLKPVNTKELRFSEAMVDSLGEEYLNGN